MRSLRAGPQWLLTQEDQKKYNEVLNPGNDGIMGYIEIPKINCNLPIYHSVDEGILQTSIGHIPGSSVPVDGEGTHCVLSGHRGLPSAKLFSELDRLSEGDSFLIRTLDEVLTYEVDRILIVLPKDTDALCIEENGDYCTLVTCTPYGVNSHRMLVRGRRIENASAANTVRVAADAIQVEPIIVAPFVAIPILLILLIWVLGRKPRKNHSRRINIHEEKTAFFPGGRAAFMSYNCVELCCRACICIYANRHRAGGFTKNQASLCGGGIQNVPHSGGFFIRAIFSDGGICKLQYFT